MKRKSKYPKTIVVLSHELTMDGRSLGIRMVKTKVITAQDEWDMRMMKAMFQKAIASSTPFRTPIIKKS